MLCVVRALESLQELAIAVYAADILRRASMCSVQAARILRAILRRKNSLNDKRLFPVVAEIVIVPKAKSIAGNQLAQLRGSLILGGIVHADIRVRVPNLVCIVAHHKLMQV